MRKKPVKTVSLSLGNNQPPKLIGLDEKFDIIFMARRGKDYIGLIAPADNKISLNQINADFVELRVQIVCGRAECLKITDLYCGKRAGGTTWMADGGKKLRLSRTDQEYFWEKKLDQVLIRF
jgi:hypothetical protein